MSRSPRHASTSIDPEKLVAAAAPLADRGQLQQIIAGLNDGVILINPDHTIAWANAMALRLHGVDDAAALGATAAEYRGRFELRYPDQHDVPEHHSPIERLLAGEVVGEVVLEIRRLADHRRWIHEIRTMILTDDAGRPSCFVLIINDETERFNAEERFERAFGANPAPAIIARLSDMRYVKVNHGFLELTGFKRDELIGRSLHEFDVLAGAERRTLAVERLHAGQTIPQMEGCLALPGGLERTVLLGGQPIEIGDEACMLFTFADLHPRQQAQRALKHSEERFATAFHMAPGPMAILALDGLRILDVNSAFTAATTWRREEVVGRAESELALFGDGTARAQNERMLRETGHLRGVDIELRAKSGWVGFFLLSAEIVEIHGSACVLTVMLDITERRQTETDLLEAVQSVMQDNSWLSQRSSNVWRRRIARNRRRAMRPRCPRCRSGSAKCSIWSRKGCPTTPSRHSSGSARTPSAITYPRSMIGSTSVDGLPWWRGRGRAGWGRRSRPGKPGGKRSASPGLSAKRLRRWSIMTTCFDVMAKYILLFR